MSGRHAFDELLRTQGPCALFESTTPPGPRSARTLLARMPHAILTVDREAARIATAEGLEDAPKDPALALRRLLALVPPAGAVVGVLAYDLVRRNRAPAPTPALVALAVDRMMVEEQGVAVSPAPPDAVPLPSWDAGASDPAWAAPLAIALPPVSLPPPALPLDLATLSSLSREQHRDLVLRVQEHIGRGDIYQANLSQRFRVPFPHQGLALYEELRGVSPAPFAGYFRACGLEIVSASPERLLEVRDGVASTRPIAGTRPRSIDAATDRGLARELLLSEKERAEHLMLVDLARNDLGIVAEIGSVEVDELMVVEDYAQVRHIVSNVRARLAPGRDALDALFALFPGGTITGVPKRRCMEILDRLEPVPRGFYTGALFYVTPQGHLDANILIRSAVVTPGLVTFHTGGGIVADSDPDFEYQETLHKARGMKLALEEILGRC
jgi:anthranilate/para-aminobenzoate synthase component I